VGLKHIDNNYTGKKTVKSIHRECEQQRRAVKHWTWLCRIWCASTQQVRSSTVPHAADKGTGREWPDRSSSAEAKCRRSTRYCYRRGD